MRASTAAQTSFCGVRVMSDAVVVFADVIHRSVLIAVFCSCR